MSEERKGFLGGLFSKRHDDEQLPEEQEQEQVPAQDAPAEEDDEVRVAIRTVDAAVAENREGIVHVDAALRAVVERLDQVETTLRALAGTETEKVKESMRSGGFLDQLWSAARNTDAPEGDPEPTTKVESEVDLSDVPNSPAAKIAAAQRRTS
jgi:hypothetical protein